MLTPDQVAAIGGTTGLRFVSLAAVAAELCLDPIPDQLVVEDAVGRLVFHGSQIRIERGDHAAIVANLRAVRAALSPAALDELRTAAPSGPRSDANQVALRLAVCVVCPDHKHDTDRCRLMGCACTCAQRAGLAVGKCPGGKW